MLTHSPANSYERDIQTHEKVLKGLTTAKNKVKNVATDKVAPAAKSVYDFVRGFVRGK